jgi:hypothetical protein
MKYGLMAIVALALFPAVTKAGDFSIGFGYAGPGYSFGVRYSDFGPRYYGGGYAPAYYAPAPVIAYPSAYCGPGGYYGTSYYGAAYYGGGYYGGHRHHGHGHYGNRSYGHGHSHHGNGNSHGRGGRYRR